MDDLTSEEQEIIKKRREALAAVYGDEMKNISDADILSYDDEQIAGLLKKDEPAPITKADLQALYDAIERQGKALDAFAEKQRTQDQNIATVNQNVNQMAEAVTPLIKTFEEFAPKADGGGSALVPHGGNGNGGGKMDIMSLLQNPVVQRLLGAGGEQVNPMDHFVSQVKQVTELLSTLDEIRGKPGRNAGITPGNIDMSTLLKGMQWGYRIKNGQLPPGLLQALGGDENGGDAPPNIIVVQQPPETVKPRRDDGGEHKI